MDIVKEPYARNVLKYLKGPNGSNMWKYF